MLPQDVEETRSMRRLTSARVSRCPSGGGKIAFVFPIRFEVLQLGSHGILTAHQCHQQPGIRAFARPPRAEGFEVALEIHTVRSALSAPAGDARPRRMCS